MRSSIASKPGGSEAVKREQLNRHYQKLARLAPTSLAAHAALFHRSAPDNRPLVPARHHEEWIRALQDRENFRWLVLVAPPGIAKSTWVSKAYVSWRIGQTKGRVRFGLVSNNAGLAEGFGQDVAGAISNPHFYSIYGEKPNPSWGWSQAEMWTSGAIDRSNPTLHAVGLHGNIQGHRYDEIVLDDPTTWEEARSDTTMDVQKSIVRNTLLERFPPGLKPPDGLGRMVVVLTRWHTRDLVETFRAIGFKIITMPAIGWWDRQAKCPTCEQFRDPDIYSLLRRCEHCDSAEKPEMVWGEEALWPEVESLEALHAKRDLEPTEFELVYQGNPEILSGKVFDVGKINRGRMPPPADFTKIVLGVDTAGGKDRKKGDYFVIATLGLRGNEVWVIDIYRERIPAPEQQQKVIEKWREFRPWGASLVVIEEKNEGIALLQNLIVQNEERMPLQGDTPTMDKDYRATPFANRVNRGDVWVPVRGDGTPYPWVTPFELELAAFPGRHDDMVDASALAYGKSTASGPRLRVLRSDRA